MAAISDVSVGWIKESVYGTTPALSGARWLEFLDESFDYKWEAKGGPGLRVGASGVALGTKRSHPTGSGSGDFTIPLTSKGMGTLLELAMGTSVSNLVSGTTYQQNHTLATGNLLSGSFQKGLVDAGGTVHPYTFAGAVCSGFEINVPQNDVATLKTSWDFRALATATSYQSPSYPSGGVQFDWGMAAVGYGGTLTMPTTTALASGTTSLTNVRDFNMQVSHSLAADRYNMGASGLKALQVAGQRSISGSLTVEYTDDVLRDAHLNKTSNAMTLTFTSAESLSTGTSQLQITLPQVWITGAMPKVNNGELITTQFTWEATYNGTNAPLTVSVRTADAAL